MKKYLFIIASIFFSFEIFASDTDNIRIPYFDSNKELTFEECDALGIKPLEIGNGEFLMPRHDGVNYFIERSDFHVSKEIPKLKIQEIIKKAEQTSNYYRINDVNSIITGLADITKFKSLPLVLKIENNKTNLNLNLNVVILSIIFRKNETLAQIAVTSETTIKNADGEDEILYFGSELALSKGGGVKGAIKLISPKEIEIFDLNGIGKLNIATSTGFCFGCNGKEGSTQQNVNLYLGGSFDFNPNIAVAEKADGTLYSGDKFVPSLFFGIQVDNWEDLSLQLTLPMEYGIRFKKFDKIGFHNLDTTADFIPSTDFCNVKLTNNTNIQLNFTGTQKGILFKRFRVRLPGGLREPGGATANKVSLVLEKFSITEKGVSATATLNSNKGLLGKPLKLGDGYDVQLTDIGFKINEDKLETFFIKGDLRLPTENKENYSAIIFGIGLMNPGTSNSFDKLKFTAGKKSEGKSVINIFGVQAALKDYSATADLVIDNWNLESLEITLGGRLSFKDEQINTNLIIKDFVVTNKSPFFKQVTIGLDGNDSTAAKIGGFAFDIREFTLYPPDSIDRVLANSRIELQLGRHNGSNATTQESKATSIKAGGKFSILAHKKHEVESDKYYFEFEGVRLNGVSADMTTGTFDFHATLDWYNNQPAFGVGSVSGFMGEARLKFNIANKKPEVSASAIFITVEDKYKAWAIDASVSGLNLGLAPPMRLQGVFGGVYKNFKMTGNKISGGRTATGLGYKISEGNWGFNIGLDLDVTSKVKMSAMLAAEGIVGKGLKWIKGIGYAEFKVDASHTLSKINDSVFDNFNSITGGIANVSNPVQELNLTLKDVEIPGRPKRDYINKTFVGGLQSKQTRIGASVTLTMNFGVGEDEVNVNGEPNIGEQNQPYFSIILEPMVEIAVETGAGNSELNSTGFGILYISEQKKYLHLGNVDNRLGVNLATTVGPLNINASIKAYFMLGDGVTSQNANEFGLPKPMIPSTFMSKFESKKNQLGARTSFNQNDISAIDSGTGIALGAALSVSASFTAAFVFNVSAHVGVGFDALLVKKPNCSQTSGWYSDEPNKSWQAATQVYGYADANVRVFTVNLASLGIAFLLQANVPKPFYAKGQFLVYASVWKAKTQLLVNGKLGEECIIEEKAEVLEEKAKLIVDLTPNGSKQLSKTGNLYLQCELPSDQLIAGNQSSVFNQVVVAEFYDGTNKIETITTEVFDIKTKLLEAIKIVPSANNTLVQGKTYKVHIKTYITANAIPEERREDGSLSGLILENGIVSYVNDTKRVQLLDEKDFNVTISNKKILLTEDDLLIYPGKNQFNVYVDDYLGKGYFFVESNIVSKINEIIFGQGYQFFIEYDGRKVPININDSNWKTQFPINHLKKNTNYELAVSFLKAGVSEVVYDKHYFKTANDFTSFKDKIAAINNNNATQYNSSAYQFEIEGIAKQDLTFGKDEKFDIVKLAIDKSSDWFSSFEGRFNSYNPEFSWETPLLRTDILQSTYQYLNDGKEKSLLSSKTNINPILVYKPFYPFIFDYISAFYNNCGGESEYSDPPCRIIPKFEKGTYCFNVTHNINNFSYFKNSTRRAIGVLPDNYNEIESQICFKNKEDRDFWDLSKLKKNIYVHCKRSDYDSKPIELTFELKKDGEKIDFPLGLAIIENLKEGQLNRFVIADNSALLFYSKTLSSQECPIASKFSVESNIGRYEYNFVVDEPKPRNFLKPCLKFSDITLQKVENDCRRIKGDNCDIQGEVSSNKRWLLVSSFEEDNSKELYKVVTPFTFTFSNGRKYTFPINGKNLTGGDEGKVVIVEMDATEVTDNLKIVSDASNNYRCGDNLDKLKQIDLFTYRITGKGNDPLAACSSTEASEIYSLTPFGRLDDNQTIKFFGEKNSNVLLESGYYTYEGRGKKELFYVENGELRQKSLCGDKPVLSCSCTDIKVNHNEVDVAQISFEFLSSENGMQYLPLNIPSEGLLFTFNEDQITQLIEKQAINQANGIFELRNRTCNQVSLIAVNIPNMSVVGCKPKINCNTPISKPTIQSSLITANYGEEIVLNATGCASGRLVWNNGKTGTTITEKITNDTKFAVVCTQNGCESESSEVHVRVKEFKIKSSVNFACSGVPISLTAEGCSGNITWKKNGINLEFTTSSINTILTENSTFEATCKITTQGGAKEYVVSLPIVFYQSPTAPVISTDIPSIQNSKICVGNPITISATACNTGVLVWNFTSSSAFTQTIIPAQGNTMYQANCKNNFCLSSGSNQIIIEGVSLPQATIGIKEAYQNTICSGMSAKLEANGCNANDEIFWYESLGTSLVELSNRGSSIEITLSNSTANIISHYYAARCRRNIGSVDTPKWCEGQLSTLINVKVLNTTNSMAINPSFSEKSICSYGSATLSATGCNYGKIEWQKEGNSDWISNTSISVSGEDNTRKYFVRCNLNNNCFNEEYPSNNKYTQVIVYQEPLAPTSLISGDSDNEFCDGYKINLTGTCSTGTIGWEMQNGKSLAITSFIPHESVSYYGFCTSNPAANLVCRTQPMNRTKLDIKVHTIPPKPVIVSSKGWNICSSESTEISAASCDGGTLYWKIDGGTETTNPELTNINQSHTYKVRCQVWECTSEWSDVSKLTVHVLPAAPVITSSISNEYVCGGSVTLTASGCSGGTIYWYNNSNNVEVSQGATFTQNTSGNYAYYAKCKNTNGCFGMASDIKNIDIRNIPSAPIVSNGNSCDGKSVSISASGCSTYNWSNSLASQSSHTISNLPVGIHNYSVYCSDNGCSSESVVVLATVNSYPAKPSLDEKYFCDKTQLNVMGCSSGMKKIQVIGSNSSSFIQDGAEITVLDGSKYLAYCEVDGCGTYGDILIPTIKRTPTPSVVSSSKTKLCNGETTSIVSVGGDGQEVKYIRYNLQGTINYYDDFRNINAQGEYYKSHKNIFGDLVCEATSNKILVSTVTADVPTITVDESPCCHHTLSYNGCEGGVVKWWYGGINNENDPLKSGTWNNIEQHGGTTYFKCTKEGCVSKITQITTADKPLATDPTITTHSQTIVNGASIILSAKGCNGVYAWSNGSVGQSIVVNPTQTTTYQLTCKTNSCCESIKKPSVTITVVCKTNITISGGNTATTSPTIVLSASGADSYLWSNGSTSSSITVDVGNKQDYSVTGSLNGCMSDTKSVWVGKCVSYLVSKWSPYNWNENHINCDGTPGEKHGFSLLPGSYYIDAVKGTVNCQNCTATEVIYGPR